MKRTRQAVGDGPRPTDPSHATRNEDAGTRISRRGCGALGLLLEAYHYALELDRNVWDFAVEVDDLRAAGLTSSDFRWLVCKGFVEHGREITQAGETVRGFQPSRGLTFGKKTCFVLTEFGAGFTRGSAQQPLELDERIETIEAEDGDLVPDSAVPEWDRDRQELRVGALVVKQFKVPAANQERILAAFEEEGWPVRIDDPLPPNPEQDSRRRLHDTINSLNRNQKNSVIRFQGDGRGQGIRWELVSLANNGRATGNPPR